jgi:lipid-A-disaccharide synthase
VKKDRPDLVILIDYPDFNLPIAKAAKKSGIKVFTISVPGMGLEKGTHQSN